jgi:hypothetical protein
MEIIVKLIQTVIQVIATLLEVLVDTHHVQMIIIVIVIPHHMNSVAVIATYMSPVLILNVQIYYLMDNLVLIVITVKPITATHRVNVTCYPMDQHVIQIINV